MKICNKCKQSKELSEFGKENKSKDLLKNVCKECHNSKAKNHSKTKNGLITKIYHNQVYNSKAKKRNPPSYTRIELSEWLLNDWLFDLLYSNWKNLGYQREMSPSIDRIKNEHPYSLDNIQITTWMENKQRGHDDIKNNIITHGNNPQKSVNQFQSTRSKKIGNNGTIMVSKGKFIQKFHSLAEAERITKVSNASISMCCNNKMKSSGGFIWEFC